MAAKIPRPFTDDEFRAWCAELNAAEIVQRIADRYGMTVKRHTVIGWRKRMGIEGRPYSPFTQNAKPCPFSPERLKEMYWKEALSIGEIRQRYHDATGDTVSQGTVQAWMEAEGIPWRTQADGVRVRALTHPAEYQEYIKNARNSPNYDPSNNGNAGERLRKVQKKGIRAAARKKKKECWETRRCARPGCNNMTTRRKSHFRHPPETTYCGHSCANTDMARVRRERENQAAWDERMSPQINNSHIGSNLHIERKNP